NPVRGAGPADTARRVGEPLPELRRLRRDLPPELGDAIDAAVDPEPEYRPSLAELRDALDAALSRLDDEPGVVDGAVTATWRDRTRLFRRRDEDADEWDDADGRGTHRFEREPAAQLADAGGRTRGWARP